MEEPRIEGGSAPTPRSFRGSRQAWWLHLLILGAYPLMMAVMSASSAGESEGAALSPSLGRLFVVVAVELLLFAVWFGTAWGFSGATLKSLLFRWNHAFLTPMYGFLYSVGLRMGVGVIMLITLLGISVVSGDGLSEIADGFRPDIGKVVDTQELASDPTYLLVNCTVVSFVLAGFREELWRVGMLVALFVLFPKMDAGFWGRLGAVALVALLFGLGHAVQGGGAVWMTFLLGLGLGGMIVYHRSIWEAVIAHGFFDASTFLMIFAIKRYLPEAVPGL